jgi:hypothetical protein
MTLFIYTKSLDFLLRAFHFPHLAKRFLWCYFDYHRLCYVLAVQSFFFPSLVFLNLLYLLVNLILTRPFLPAAHAWIARAPLIRDLQGNT